MTYRACGCRIDRGLIQFESKSSLWNGNDGWRSYHSTVSLRNWVARAGLGSKVSHSVAS
jgi:hypothetical protein